MLTAKDGIKLTFLGTNRETVRVTRSTWREKRSPHVSSSTTPPPHGSWRLEDLRKGSSRRPSIPYTNGSDANSLKLFGDINGDGSLVYVEYYCDNGDAGTAGSHNLYRNMMSYDAAGKPALTNSNILLSNVYPNPPDTGGAERPCFKYQTVTINNTLNPDDSHTYVLDVAITLTVQTQLLDPITRAYQTETKALLNVSPRNVFNTWMLAGNSLWSRVQPTPQTVTGAAAEPLDRVGQVERVGQVGQVRVGRGPRDVMHIHQERGVALVLALFLMSAMSVLTASLMFLSQTETYASMNYRMMSQARYAAESGVQKAANFLLDSSQYKVPGTSDGDG